MILLDTHAFIWLASTPERLSEAARTVILRHSSTLHISCVSAWEIALLCRKKRLLLPLPPEQFIEEAIAHLHLIELPLTRKTVLHSVSLPPVHNDPFDRVLIAECRLNRFSLVSADRVLPRYPEVEGIW
jgi:PIN domain nuclease of toxin-antitoxin system